MQAQRLFLFYCGVSAPMLTWQHALLAKDPQPNRYNENIIACTVLETCFAASLPFCHCTTPCKHPPHSHSHSHSPTLPQPPHVAHAAGCPGCSTPRARTAGVEHAGVPLLHAAVSPRVCVQGVPAAQPAPLQTPDRDPDVAGEI